MRTIRFSVLLTSAVLAAGCGSSVAPSGTTVPAQGGKTGYGVTITRTAMGIPHVKADDWGSLGYGLGYAFAEDNLCLLLEDLATIRGQRAKFFGRNGTYRIFANSTNANNVDSDFFWKLINSDAEIAKLKKAALPEAAQATFGYKDGINRYIRELKTGQHAGRHARCRNEPWLIELTEDDMYRRYRRLSVLASSSVFVSGIAQAKPPAVSARQQHPLPSATQIAKIDRTQFPFSRELPIGSNMYALSKDATANGQSIQFMNPHFPWEGTERLYMSHLTLPGKVDIMGSSLYGVPAILIGFNDKLAWSHTVSTAYRFTFYELTLVPGDPTSYLYDGQVMKMNAVPLSVEIKNDDGSMTTESRTLYTSKYGPMLFFEAVSGVNIFPWSPLKAYAIRDANAENTRLINQFFRWNQAKSLSEFIELHGSVLGVPWVNTTATGPKGKAYYGDVTVVPHVTDDKAQQCGTSVQAQAINQLAPGLPLLDGSRSACEWGTDADAPAPGIFGRKNLPTLLRDDWVVNANDSYWLTNPAQLIEGYSKIIGAERTARSLRTRHAILKIQSKLTGATPARWTPETLKESVLDAKIYSADLEKAGVLSTICATGQVMTTGGPVDVREACQVLSDWDNTNNLDSVGGHVWREFWRGAAGAPGITNQLPIPGEVSGGLSAIPVIGPILAGLLRPGTRTASPVGIPVIGPWTTPFSVDDPVNTPRGLNVALPTVQAALGDAVLKFQNLGIPLDAPFRNVQRSKVHGEEIPIFGGVGNLEGAFTIATGDLTDKGYRVNFGNSHVSVVTWDDQGRAIADAFITYSQSTDPANPHFNDFTKAYSEKKWLRLPFHEDEVREKALSTLTLSE